MTAALHCYACGHRLGRRARCAVIGGAVLLCGGCAADVRVHHAIFFNCREQHRPIDHGTGALIGRGVAAWLLAADR